MSQYKSVKCTGTVGSVSDAFSALEELGNECREIVDNASEGLSQTSRIQTLDETAGTLEGLSEPDVPEVLSEVSIEYSESVPRRKRSNTSRATRRDNAVSVLQACAEAAQGWLDDDANAEHDDRDDVQTFIDEVESLVADVEGCEFPGMFGG